MPQQSQIIQQGFSFVPRGPRDTNTKKKAATKETLSPQHNIKKSNNEMLAKEHPKEKTKGKNKTEEPGVMKKKVGTQETQRTQMTG